MVYLYIPPRYKRPQIYLEEPRRLTIPIVVSQYRHRPTTVIQTLEKPRRWSVRHKPKPITQPTVKKRGTPICQWYKRKQALQELNEYDKKEKKRKLKEQQDIESKRKQALQELNEYDKNEKKRKLKEQQDIERRERENQLREHYKLQEQVRYNETSDPSTSEEGKRIKQKKVKQANVDRKAQKRADKERKRERGKEQHFKLQERETDYPFERGEVPAKKTWRVKQVRKYRATKTSWAKPKAASRSVSVKRQDRYGSLSNRFVNCFYRVCCQFYCYLTCLITIGFIVIFLL